MNYQDHYYPARLYIRIKRLTNEDIEKLGMTYIPERIKSALMSEDCMVEVDKVNEDRPYYNQPLRNLHFQFSTGRSLFVYNSEWLKEEFKLYSHITYQDIQKNGYDFYYKQGLCFHFDHSSDGKFLGCSKNLNLDNYDLYVTNEYVKEMWIEDFCSNKYPFAGGEKFKIAQEKTNE